MGSHDRGRADDRLPFGLTFEPFELSTVPILSDEEDRYLSQFMDAVVSGHDFPVNLGEGLNFVEDISQWYGGPEVVAHGTSIGGSSSSFAGFPRPVGEFDTVCPAEVIPPLHHGDIPDLPADVLAAATALTRPIPAHPLPTPSFDLSSALQPSPIPIGPSPAAAAATAATAPPYTFTVPLFAEHDTRSRPRNEQDAFAQMFAGSEPNPVLYRPVTEAYYGSDPNFNRPSNQPPAWEPLDSIRSQQDAVMGSFTRIDSAAPTRAPSPVLQNPAPPWPSSTPDSPAPASAISQCPPVSVESAWPTPAPPPKKRKTSGDGEPVVKREAGDATSAEPWKSPSSERQRQPSEDEEPNGESRKRRKSKTCWGAPRVKPKPPPRENLTDEQKRENHIKSEQKRRTAIKEDYEELFHMVPTVHVPGPPTSKSHVLNEAANFIRSITEGNVRLKARLAALEKSPT